MVGREGGLDPRLPLVFTSGQALAAGISRRTHSARVRQRRWVRLRRGVFCLVETVERTDRVGRHLLDCMAAQCSRPGTVVSHLSAAAAHGWPLPRGGLGPPWLTLPSAWSGPRAVTGQSGDLARAVARRAEGVRVEAAALPPGDVVRLRTSCLLVTTPARTVADCLRHLPLADAVAVADGAGRTVTRQDVLEVLARQGSWPYAARARPALALVDPRRESWLESVAVVGLSRGGAGVPQAQASVFDRRGRFVARPDFWWPDLGVVGEVDGWSKYRQRLASVTDAERALREEKVREDRLRDLGLEVARASTEDVVAGGVYLARWRRARERGDAGRVRATIVPAPWPAHWPAP